MTREQQQEAVLEGLADGKSLRAICRADGMPAASTVILWASQDDDFAEQYARARKAGDDAMAEDIQEIADDKTRDPQDRKVAIDARKWLLAKRQPKKYGESTMLKHADADGEKIPLDDVSRSARLAALAAAINARTERGDDAGD